MKHNRREKSFLLDTATIIVMTLLKTILLLMTILITLKMGYIITFNDVAYNSNKCNSFYLLL
jgi:hypothetical protein